MTNIETVQAIYSAFGRGDIPGTLQYLAEDVEWEYGSNSTNVPWLQPRNGRGEVGGFFEALNAIDITRFEVKELLEAKDLVAALIDVAASIKATGRLVVEEDEVHIWRFNDRGEVARFRHRADTLQQYMALGLTQGI